MMKDNGSQSGLLIRFSVVRKRHSMSVQIGQAKKILTLEPMVHYKLAYTYFFYQKHLIRSQTSAQLQL